MSCINIVENEAHCDFTKLREMLLRYVMAGWIDGLMDQWVV